MKQWRCIQTTYEPSHNSADWGRSCVEFHYTSEDIGRSLHPAGHFHDWAIEKAEASGKTLRLFSEDISYREVLASL